MKPQLVDFDQLPLAQILPGVTRRYLNADGATFAYLVLEKGAVVPEHHHPQEQITYIPEGRCQVTTPAGVIEIGPGQALVIPPNLPHEFLALERTIDIDIFTPPRKDFEGGGNPWDK